MVVIVPALARGQQRHEPVVPAVFAGVVRPIAEQVRQRIDAPRHVPDKHRADERAPHQPTDSQLHAVSPVATGEPAHQQPRKGKDGRVRQIDPERARRMPLQEAKVAVGEDVAGILVEKGERAAIRRTSEQPADVGPTHPIAGRVWVFRFIRVDMVQPVGCHPAGGRVFQAAEGDRRQRPLQPQRHLEAAMREEPVVAKVDTHSKHVGADQGNDQTRPTEAPRQQREACEQVHRGDRNQVFPVDAVSDGHARCRCRCQGKPLGLRFRPCDQ